MVSVLSVVAKLLDVSWLVGEHGVEVAYLKCRSAALEELVDSILPWLYFTLVLLPELTRIDRLL
jgi:hypothetical protein